jgi:hypothetical protein
MAPRHITEELNTDGILCSSDLEGDSDCCGVEAGVFLPCLLASMDGNVLITANSNEVTK